MIADNFVFDNCLRSLNYITKHYGENYVDRLLDLLSDESSNNWKIAKQYNLSLVQVAFLRANFKTLFRLSKICKPVSEVKTNAKIFYLAS